MRCAVRSTPSPDTSQPLRDSGMSPPVLRPAVPDTAACPRSDPPPATPRPASSSPTSDAAPRPASSPPSARPSAIPRSPPFAAASLPRFPAPRGTRSRTFSLPAASGMPPRPPFPSPPDAAAPVPRAMRFPDSDLFSSRPVPRLLHPSGVHALLPRACSLFPALRTPPRQKQAKFRQ